MKKHCMLLLASAFLYAPSFAAAAAPQLMSVSADAEVRVKPDRAAITFGLFEKTDNLRRGAERLNAVAKQVADYCRTRGIEDRFIQTDRLHITPVYLNQTTYAKNGVKSETEQLQYELAQTFTITLEDPAQYEDVMYALLGMGINRVENVSFYSTQMRRYRDEARRLAVKHAREKAELLAEAAGIRLGKTVNVAENTAPAWPAARYAASNVSQNITEGAAGDNLLPTPATGMISVKAAVTLTYKIK